MEDTERSATGYTAYLMHRWRSTSLLRVVAITILLWTAIDLANASACSLDNESLPASTHASTIAAVPASPDGTAPAHVDDCFCCSHCVNVQTLVIPDVSDRGASSYLPPQQNSPLLLASSYYHPPDSLR